MLYKITIFLCNFLYSRISISFKILTFQHKKLLFLQYFLSFVQLVLTLDSTICKGSKTNMVTIFKLISLYILSKCTFVQNIKKVAKYAIWFYIFLIEGFYFTTIEKHIMRHNYILLLS
jgi:hypothetical protein